MLPLPSHEGRPAGQKRRRAIAVTVERVVGVVGSATVSRPPASRAAAEPAGEPLATVARRPLHFTHDSTAGPSFPRFDVDDSAAVSTRMPSALPHFDGYHFDSADVDASNLGAVVTKPLARLRPSDDSLLQPARDWLPASPAAVPSYLGKDSLASRFAPNVGVRGHIVFAQAELSPLPMRREEYEEHVPMTPRSSIGLHTSVRHLFTH